MKFRKVPVVIDAFAIQENNLVELRQWVESFHDKFENFFESTSYRINTETGDYTLPSLKVKTLEGISYEVTSNDVIIRGIKGEYYPCKKDIFQQTYELVVNE